ncbi:phospholipase D-like domain-containing protein [Bradymonas sediminis]|uniref:phospholipase D-like domain-containing protein n=1 Tax=Bradymonas sediminis TaxID=1548548 RepID=UPI0010E439D8|nr:phospholipase D-like domain-containing protein [Bradymonas sediminis]TDP75742.1 cardiolipin synthetase 2 [Bradymonas sediminis]
MLGAAITWVAEWAPTILAVLAPLSAVFTTTHIVLHKRETRSAIGWIGLSWLVPFIGSALYLMLGVNRIRRRAVELRGDRSAYAFRDARSASFNPGLDGEAAESAPSEYCVEGSTGRSYLPVDVAHLGGLIRVVNEVATRPLLTSNNVDVLFNGEQAYPAMLKAIGEAKTSIALSSFIFDNDKWGRIFADALAEASERGVAVRVLVDAAGLHYSFPSIMGYLRRKKVRAARFLPQIFPPHLMTANLRNHRKILVVDGQIGFTGGMNIRTSHMLEEPSKQPTKDIHFRLAGPVVSHLQEVFVDDWNFATGEELRGTKWFPAPKPAGKLLARGIADGPDDNLDKMPWMLLGAITAARESIRIVTPYFLPDPSLIDALNLAAMRGVEVDVIMPGKNNLPYVQWASFGLMRPLLQFGCRAWLTAPPFEHSKVMVVDRHWMVFGSSNWDPRSHRLNFEFDVECYDGELAGRLDDWACAKLEDATQITLEDYDKRGFWRQLRDGTFRLMSPYL